MSGSPSERNAHVSASIVVIRPGSRENVELTTTTTGLDLFGEDRTIVAMRVGGEIRDLQRELADGDEVEPVLADSDEGGRPGGCPPSKGEVLSGGCRLATGCPSSSPCPHFLAG